ncbi:MAG: CopD family protein, partial [Actinobacteria bacterium]|nr:CopD family protein [Actinomycetota bacterium]
AFLVTAATGVIRGSQELATLSDLWRSDYGKVLAAKSIGVLVMVPLSILAWRRVVSRPRAEAVVALAVIGAAALLAAFPLPPGRAAEAEQAAAETPQISALPEPNDLTIGAYARDVLLGVTLRPGEPGVNQVLVYVLPVEGEEEAEEVRVEAAMGDTPLRLEVCGPTCRRSSATMRGGEVLSLQLSGTKSGRTEVEIPALPAADAGSVLQMMDSRMRTLQTLRIDETLRPAKSPVSAKYTLQAPDRFRMEVSSGYQSVTIGDVRYRRTSPSAEWDVEPGGPSMKVPFFIWGQPPLASAHVLGTKLIDGMELRVVGFFEDRGGLPIWFKQWIDSEDLVRRAEMRAQGHFMDHRYYDFDAPIVIEPPVGS